MTIKFVHPSTILVCGPTGSGKTKFVEKFISRNMLEKRPDRIIWVYSVWQPIYDELLILRPDIEFVKELIQQLYDSIVPTVVNLLILDDQMSNAGDLVTKSFTEGSHHLGITLVHLVQNIFFGGKSHRTISVNTQYMLLLSTARDKAQIDTLGRQMFPKYKHYLSDVFEEATKLPYGFLLVDLRIETPNHLRLRSDIFADEPTVYVPKDYKDEDKHYKSYEIRK